MPYFLNHSGVTVFIEDRQHVYEALLRGMKIIGVEGLARNEELQLMLQVKEFVEIPTANKTIKHGVLHD